MDGRATLSGFDPGLQGGLVVLIATLAAFFACVAPIGLVVPSQTLAIAGGFAAGSGIVHPAVQAAGVGLGAFAGSTVGYLVGRWFGGRKFLGSTIASRRWIVFSKDLLHRRGSVAIVLGRWTATTRSTLPWLAGSTNYPMTSYIVWTATTCVAWGAATTTAGYLAHAAVETGETILGGLSAAVLVFVVAVLAIGYRSWTRRLGTANRL